MQSGLINDVDALDGTFCWAHQKYSKAAKDVQQNTLVVAKQAARLKASLRLSPEDLQQP